MNYGFCIKSRPSPLIWCPDGTVGGTCTEGDIALATGLLSSWELVDNVSALYPNDQGPANKPLTFDGVTYVHDVTRGGLPGAAVFTAGAFADLTDASGIYISGENPITIGLWLRLDDKGASLTILSYVAGADTQYELIYNEGLDRLVWAVQGTLGTAVTPANTLGSPVLGQWYWVELSVDPVEQCACIRVATSRTADMQALATHADAVNLPGGIEEVPGDLVLGHSGANSLSLGVELDGFGGRMVAVDFWVKTLNNCERGYINQPQDYPWALRSTPEGDYRVDADGHERVYR